MNEVKRVEAYGLIADIRAFACEQSPGFAAGRQDGYEVRQGFYHVDPVPQELLERELISPEMCKSVFDFEAFRIPGARRKPGYTFKLAASLERTLPGVPTHILSILPKDLLDSFDNFEEIEEGALSEESRSEFDTSTYELGRIVVSHHYNISYAGDKIFESSDDDILHAETGEFASIHPQESEHMVDTLYIRDPIQHESLPGPDNVEVNKDYWSIVDPYNAQNRYQIASYRSAAERMRAIVQTLRTGEVIY